MAPYQYLSHIESLVQQLKSAGIADEAENDAQNSRAIDKTEKALTPKEQEALDVLRGRKMLRHEELVNIDNFTKDSIEVFVRRHAAR